MLGGLELLVFLGQCLCGFLVLPLLFLPMAGDPLTGDPVEEPRAISPFFDALHGRADPLGETLGLVGVAAVFAVFALSATVVVLLVLGPSSRYFVPRSPAYPIAPGYPVPAGAVVPVWPSGAMVTPGYYICPDPRAHVPADPPPDPPAPQQHG